MGKTITFDEKSNGWTSEWSFKPECMTRLNNGFFTFKNGQLYKHHSETAQRNYFYGDDGNMSVYNSEITFVFNQAPSECKHFKTISLESSDKGWDVDITTNLDNGHIDYTSFDTREGEHFAYIRRDSGSYLDYNHLSVQGLGNNTAVAGNQYSFLSVPSFLSEEDTLCYINSLSQKVPIGKIFEFTDTTIKVVAPVVPIIVPVGAFMFVAKNAVAESFGIKGNHAVVKLTSVNSSSPKTLFVANSEVFKSFH
jgi:hypothetical protein